MYANFMAYLTKWWAAVRRWSVGWDVVLFKRLFNLLSSCENWPSSNSETFFYGPTEIFLLHCIIGSKKRIDFNRNERQRQACAMKCKSRNATYRTKYNHRHKHTHTHTHTHLLLNIYWKIMQNFYWFDLRRLCCTFAIFIIDSIVLSLSVSVSVSVNSLICMPIGTHIF